MVTVVEKKEVFWCIPMDGQFALCGRENVPATELIDFPAPRPNVEIKSCVDCMELYEQSGGIPAQTDIGTTDVLEVDEWIEGRLAAREDYFDLLERDREAVANWCYA